MKKSSLPAEEPRNLAEQVIDHHRKRFIGLYPTELHFLLNCLTGSYEWKWSNGLVSTSYTYDDQPLDVTEDGWGSLRLGRMGHLPTSWPEPRKDSPLFNIPEDAKEEWLDECWTVVYTVGKIKEAAYEQYVTGYYCNSGMGQTYVDDAIQRCMSGFRNCRKMIEDMKVSERINRIRTERHEKTLPPRPAQVAEGVTVRALAFEQTAKVIRLLRVGSDAPYQIEACELDTAIDGKTVWAKSALKVVS